MIKYLLENRDKTIRTCLQATVSVFVFLLVFSTISYAAPNDNEVETVESKLLEAEMPYLEKGELPESFTRRYRIVDPNSEESKTFQIEMEKLAKKILPAHDFASNPIRFLLVDTDIENAFTFRFIHPTTIFFTKAKIKSSNTEAKLGLWLGHEYFHTVISKKYGSDTHNSKGEELAADAFGLDGVKAAELNPQLSVEQAERLLHRKSGGVLDILFDIHPMDEYRVAFLNQKLASYYFKSGDFSDAPDYPLSPELLAAAEKAQFLDSKNRQEYFGSKSYFEKRFTKEYKMKYKVDTFDELNDKDRITLLTEWLNKDKVIPNTQKERILDNVHTLLQDLTLKAREPSSEDKELIRALEKHFDCTDLADFSLYYPMGTFQDLYSEYLLLLKTPSKEEAASSVKNIKKMLVKTGIRYFPKSDYNWIQRFLEFRQKASVFKWLKKNANRDLHSVLLAVFPDDEALLHSAPLDLALEHKFIFKGDTKKTINNILQDRMKNEIEALFKKAMKGNSAAKRDFLNIDRTLLPDLPHDLSSLPLSELAETQLEVFLHRYWPMGEPYNTILSNLAQVKQLTELLYRIAEKNEPQDVKTLKRFVLSTWDKPSRTFFFKSKYKVLISDDLLLETFILKNPNNIFSEKERIQLLANSFSTTRRTEYYFWSLAQMLRSTLSIEEIRSSSDLVAACKAIENNPWLSDLQKQHLITASASEYMQRCLADQKKRNGFIDFPMLYLLRNNYLDIGKDTMGLLVDRIAWPINPVEIVELVSFIKQFDDSEKTKEFLQQQMDRAIRYNNQTKDPERRLAFFGALLRPHAIKLSYETKLAITNKFLDASVAFLGIDEGQAEFNARLKKVIEFIPAAMPIIERESLLNTIADQTELQTPNASISYANILTKHHLESSTMTGRQLEVFMTHFSSTEEREEILTFLMSEGSLTDIARFKYAIENLVGFNNRDHTLIENGNKTLAFLKALRKNAFDKSSPDELLSEFHKEFWNYPMEFRVMALSHLLFHARTQSQEGDFEDSHESLRAFLYVAELLFPQRQPLSHEARIIVKAIHESLPSYAQPVLLAALVAAGKKDSKNSSNNKSVGEKLALLFEIMGPWEVKFGQAIHSNAETPEDIKQGLSRMKSKVDLPKRWELTKWIDQTLSKEHRGQIKHIGKIRNAGSINIVVDVVMKDGSEKVLIFIRPDSRSRVARSFTLMTAAQKILDKEKKLTERARRILARASKRAKEAAYLETDPVATMIQIGKASQMYDNTTIKIGERTFHITTPKVYELGTSYRIVEKAEGVSFNELPEDTPEALEFKKEVAKAHYALELFHILTGNFDYDRHGEQIKVHGDKIYILDPGGIMVTPPTEEEQKEMGRFLGHILSSYAKEESIEKAMDQYILQFEKRGASSDHLVTLQQALLALNDYKKFIEPAELQQIAKTVFSDSHTNSILKEELWNTLLQQSQSAFKESPLIHGSKEDCLIIQILKLE